MDALSLIAREPIEPDGQTTLWQQLRRRILQVIASGALSGGDLLPTERDICTATGLSRTTVRKAFEKLASEGRIVRSRGRGTFVRRATHEASDGYGYSFTAEMRAAGRVPSSKVVGFRCIPAEGLLAERLEVAEGEPLWEIRRLRLADDEPMSYHRVYVPRSYCPSLTSEGLSESVLAAIARETGILPSSMEGAYEAVCLDVTEARLLGQRRGAPALRLVRTNYANDGRPYEVAIIISRADRFQLKVRSDGSEGTFRKTLA